MSARKIVLEEKQLTSINKALFLNPTWLVKLA